ncbi:hypothetical protein J2X46_002621 [Nocardioides sp. BE266]|uniref:hypothetical protein n=1 Tax=Nocardioides sp. BE266 TaxID=2817725 RepID=UPI002857FFD1|nr:hypothetical protein [Nocardioides sp. BE266]MDR7253631.1 hypothetical protein [Nocardioides sp. BE266]
MRPSSEWRAHLAAIRPDADPAEAEWWDTDWGPDTPAAVGFLVPRGFEAYARVLHPAHDGERDAVTWATVAEETGTTLHPEAQWHRIAGGREYDPRGEGIEPRRWPGNEPRVGVLERPQFEALVDVLARHTTSPGRSIVGFWVGYGVWPVAWHTLPTAPGPGRESYLFERPVSEVVTLCAEAPAVAYALGTPTGTSMVIGGPPPTADEEFEIWAPHQWQSPSAWWPADRAWATSNDTDLDSTLVGGTRALVDDLLADERLEVLPWPVDGSLWSDADTINV